MGQEITIVRSSKKTGECSEIILRDRNGSKIVFKPRIIDNSRESSESVSGKLIYIKDEFDDNGEIKLSPSKIRKSDWMEIELKTSEVKALFEHLRNLYSINPNEIRNTKTYISIDTEYNAILNYFKKMPAILEKVIVEKASLEIINRSKPVLKAIASNNDILESLLDTDDALENISYLAQIKSIKKLCYEIEHNLSNSNEEYWQNQILAKNTWILSQIFAEPMIVLKGKKAFLGGKDIDNKGGKIVDFAYINKLTNHIAFIEIKTPTTKLVGGEYRTDVYPLSTEMSGALAQIMSYKKIFEEEYLIHKARSEEMFCSCNPKTVIIAGTISSLAEGQRDSFELHRRELKDTVVITFDELLERIKGFLSVLQY